MTDGNSPDKDSSNEDLSKSDGKKKQRVSSKLMDKIRLPMAQCRKLIKKRGIHSVIYMSVTGFEYTGDGDTVRCKDCGLQVSNWTVDMKPFTIHSNRNPLCPFILKIKLSALPTMFNRTELQSALNTSLENYLLQQIRIRTFSHWPHRNSPLTAHMMKAGFFSCNVGDRVICIYCNLICQQWTPHTDDPCEIHRTCSPNCSYVRAKLIRSSAISTIIAHERQTEPGSPNYSSTSSNLDLLRSNKIVLTVAYNPAYFEIPTRRTSFATWPHENLPPVDDLVRAGFFYTGTKTIVTCFYCNGSLQNWGPTDNPMIEHARWFPHCVYAKQLCGDELYRKIQESKQAQQERAEANEAKEKTSSGIISNTNVFTNSGQLLIPDEHTLSRFVAARLDLPISQRLLDQGFRLSIIKRCWEDQLRLKRDNFVSELDLYVACVILQKQINVIDGKKENIVIPNIKMKQMEEQNKKRMAEQSTTTLNATESASQTTGAFPTADNQNQSNDSNPSNLCVLCLTEEKRLACIPCGHLATCIPCGHSLRSCPICRREIEAFVRIYI